MMDNVSYDGAFRQEKWYIAMREFYFGYLQFHSPLSITLAVFGVAFNLVFVLVLSRPSMRSSVNSLLTAIAVCDVVCMCSLAVYHSLLVSNHNNGTDCVEQPYGHIAFTLCHAIIGVYAHATSLWLTVVLAGLRYVIVRNAAKRHHSLNQPKIARWLIVSTFSFMLALCIPNSLMYSILPPAEDSDCVSYSLGLTTFAHSNGSFTTLYSVNFWIGGIAFKIIPCVLLSIFMALLLHVLLLTTRRREQILGKQVSRHGGHDNTTAMLIIIVFVFLLTELPQGILTVMGGVYGQWFTEGIYNHLGDVLDLLAIINSCVNFVLYCFMSRQFRQVFVTEVVPENVKKSCMVVRRLVCRHTHSLRSIEETSVFTTERSPKIPHTPSTVCANGDSNELAELMIKNEECFVDEEYEDSVHL